MMITILLTNGGEFRFEQKDRIEAERILSGIRPTRLYDQKQLLFHGRSSVSGFNTAQVECVALQTDLQPPWEDPGRMNFRLMTKEMFAEVLAQRGTKAVEVENADRAPATEQSVLAEFVLASDRRVYMMAQRVAADPIDANSVLARFLDTGGFAVSGEKQFLLVNPHAIVRWTMYPGPPTAPQQAWRASRVG